MSGSVNTKSLRVIASTPGGKPLLSEETEVDTATTNLEIDDAAILLALAIVIA